MSGSSAGEEASRQAPRSPRRDEVADQREKRAQGQLPRQRNLVEGLLTDAERERYELQLDAYEVQLHEYQSRLEQAAAQLEAASHDGLTGAWLRHAGTQLLEEELQRAARTDSPLSIAFVDVDGLKARNDTDGHAAGDAALVTVARALLVGLRGYDHVVRWGGDEFLCVLPGVRRDEAVGRLEQARRFLSAGPDGLTISVGVVERHAGEGLEGLVARADAELYASRGQRGSSVSP